MFKKLIAATMALLAAAAFAAVDVNKADATALDSVKGIGPGIAGKILEERKKGNFKDWNDLITRVNGIGETSAAKLSDAGLTVNGGTFKGVAAAPAKKDEKPAAKAAAAAPATAPAAATAEKKTETKAEKKTEAKVEKKTEEKAEAKAEKQVAKKEKAPKKDEKKDEKKSDKKAEKKEQGKG